jgi:excinuclease ABC subunit C
MIETATLPHEPGCYLFRDADGTILYIGKAKDLKKRVSSYFRKRDLDPKTRLMVEAAESLDYIVTGNEVEALILENSLIKKHQPQYNIDLKDAKAYAYIHLTDDPFPAIRIARNPSGKGTFFGPFVSAAERDYIRDVLKRTFRLRTCKKIQKRGCLRYHIHTCSAPCKGAISSEEYAHLVRNATLVLKGKTAELLGNLKQEMAERSRREDFEGALVIRDQIHALEHLSSRQDISRRKEGDEDIINYRAFQGTVHLMLFNVYRGTLGNKSEFSFDYHPEFFEEFLIQYYSDNPIPAEIILPEPVGEPVGEFLSLARGKQVTVTVPKIGAKRRLLDLVAKNIETVFYAGQVRVLELQEALGLDSPPEMIECFDISHLSGSSLVGSMVRFRNGKPEKKQYRRFRIRTVEGIDDPKAIGEIIRRRYTRLLEEGAPLPDLIVVDGGRTQLSSALAVLKEISAGIPVIALAKREEQVFVPGRTTPLPLSRKEQGSLYLQEIRDEAHRFAIAYHHLLRKKELVP